MRYSSIDILRTLAIVVMVLVHFAENLSGIHLPITGFGAPLFAFLSGLSYLLWVRGLETKGVSDEEISKSSIRRGLFVFGAGFAFNVFAWLPEDTFNWDVLTFIGTALLLLNGLRRLPLPIPILIAVLSVLISPLLRDLADYPAYWVNGYFECEWTLSEILIGFLATGYFPIFPWIAYSIAGLVTGTLMYRGEAEANASRVPVILGAVFMLFAGALLFVRESLPIPLAQHFLGGWHMFPASIEYVVATIGLALFSFGIVHQLVDRIPGTAKNQTWLDIAKTFSRYSLTIYVLHHLVHLWPLWIYGVMSGEDPTYYWKQAMPLSYSLALGVLFLVVCYFALRKIGPDRRLGIEGWMRWLCDS